MSVAVGLWGRNDNAPDGAGMRPLYGLAAQPRYVLTHNRGANRTAGNPLVTPPVHSGSPRSRTPLASDLSPSDAESANNPYKDLFLLRFIVSSALGSPTATDLALILPCHGPPPPVHNGRAPHGVASGSRGLNLCDW
jgi:hypothetical protein